MEQIILHEGVLNDDILYLASEGKAFKGNYVAIIEYYTFMSAWSNKRNLKRFRSKEAMVKWVRSQQRYDEIDATNFI